MLAVTYSDGSRTRIDDPSTATAFDEVFMEEALRCALRALEMGAIIGWETVSCLLQLSRAPCVRAP